MTTPLRRSCLQAVDEKVAAGPFVGLADTPSLCSSVCVERVQRAGGGMLRHERLGKTTSKGKE